MKILTILFCILSCLCVAACVPVFIYFKLWGFVCAGAAALFALLMVGAKHGFKRTPPQKQTDFMNTDEENEQIRREQNKEE